MAREADSARSPALSATSRLTCALRLRLQRAVDGAAGARARAGASVALLRRASAAPRVRAQRRLALSGAKLPTLVKRRRRRSVCGARIADASERSALLPADGRAGFRRGGAGGGGGGWGGAGPAGGGAGEGPRQLGERRCAALSGVIGARAHGRPARGGVSRRPATVQRPARARPAGGRGRGVRLRGSPVAGRPHAVSCASPRGSLRAARSCSRNAWLARCGGARGGVGVDDVLATSRSRRR